MRIGCVQFAPQVGDVDNNLNRADAVLSRANPEEHDLLVLPEMAFSGYNFKSLEHIAPYLEPSGSGITALWARTTALKYNCVVAAGYPEKVDPSPKWPTGPEYYNSAIIVNGDGETVANYRKSFLYYTDETWALEGDTGFFEGYIPGLGHTSMGICMDLNPYKFQAPWHAFEFAFHVLEYSSNFVIVSMAWMTREDSRMFSRMPNEPDMETLTYWVTRLEPLIRSENDEEIIVVFCNRTGTEDEAVYAGTSAVVGIHDGEVKVYGLLGRGEKELLVVDTDNPPYAKLLYRPDADSSEPAQGELQKISQSPAPGQQPPKFHEARSSPKSEGAQEPSSASKPPTSQAAIGSAINTATATSTKRTRPNPQIQIPQYPTRRDPASSTSATSATSAKSTGSHDIPTPTAPSPTPQAVRPKLIIPQSPPFGNWQAVSPQPMSTQSTHSVRSVQSVQSIRSNQSIKSNERPPAESTPYPDSGLPLSGYPRPIPDMQIYGGEVTITHTEDSFSPITPFDDMSPIASRYFWRPSSTSIRTPIDAALHTPVDPNDWPPFAPSPVGRRTPQASNGPAMQTEPVKRAHNSNTMRSSSATRTSRKDERYSNMGETRDRSSSRSPPTSDQSGQDNQPARPSSPKSRNASRNRNHERPDSSLAHRDMAAAVSQHLDSISQRAESANRNRNEETQSPFPDRPSSPKSRNCSRSRPTEAAASILIGASPSIFGIETTRPQSGLARPGAHNSPRPMSRMDHRSRSASISEEREPHFSRVRERSRTPTAMDRTKMRPPSRSASRGVTFSPPGSSPEDRTFSPDRARSELQQEYKRRASGSSSGSTGSPAAAQQDFAAVESVVCPNCPVHGAQASSSPDTTAEAAAAQDSSPGSESTIARTSPLPSTSDLEQVVSQASRSTPDGIACSDSGSLAETIDTLSTPGRSPSTPSFETRTPKAEVFVNETEASFEEDGVQSPSPGTKAPSPDAVERDIMSMATAPNSVAA